MKIKLTKDHIQNILKLGLFLLVAAFLIQLFPSEDKFNYKYEEGRPWTHELITASFDFPIYKSQEQVEKERKELMKDFIPYFQVDSSVNDAQLSKFISDFQKKNGYQPILRYYIEEHFRTIYERGVISTEAQDMLAQNNIQSVYCIYPNRVTKAVAVNKFQTPKEAYEEILRSAMTPSDKSLLTSYNLNNYLIPNIIYDSIRSDAAEKDLLKNLSLTMGMVQTGERIIDRGEIVTPDVYRVLNSLKIETEKRNTGFEQSSIVLIGRILMILGFMTLLYFYFFLFRPRIFDNYGNLILILSLVLFNFIMASLTVRFHSNIIHYYIVPYALLPIIIRVFFDSRTALYVHIVTSIMISFMVEEPFQFLVLQIAVGMLTVSSLKDLAQRSQLAQTALYIFLCYAAGYTACMFIAEGDLSLISWVPLVYFGISSILLLLAYILIYLFEKMFGLVSSVTLVELTNINSDLMINFAETAPGTFQHSLQVSNLATEAAKKIGANSLLVRTGALYHDIGKMKNAGYFIENQMGGKNPLLDKDYEEAAHIIIDHVTDGVKLAKKYRLPNQIINFITTHHGKSKTKYFYNSFINANPGVIPNDEAFTYPGPTPNSRETAILMMADAVEARSRSLPEYTEQTINDMVEDMIDSQIADGQLKDSPMSFQDVEVVKQVFKQKLINIYHTRIAYPKTKEEIEKEEQKEKEEAPGKEKK